jgi:membrane-bound inhibitor of C-type lysozyme
MPSLVSRWSDSTSKSDPVPSGSNSVLTRLALTATLLGFALVGCASGASSLADGAAGGSGEAPAPTDLTAAAALAFAEAADDGTAAFCAPGRYTVVTAEGPAFAMVSWGDQVALTLLDGEGSAAQRAAIEAELARYGADVAGTVTLSLTPAASGARYTGGASGPGVGEDAVAAGPDSTTAAGPDADDPPLLFWAKGDRALIQLGDLSFPDAEVRPLEAVM